MTTSYKTIIQLIDRVTISVLTENKELLVSDKEVTRLEGTSVRVTRKLLDLKAGDNNA